MTKIKAVLFDMDGTLLNTIDDLSDAANFMLRQYGYKEHSVDEYKYMVGNGMAKLMERALPEDERTSEKIKEALGIFMPYYSAHSLDKTAPYDGIIELLETLKAKGIMTAVVTNKAHDAALSLTNRIFPGLFDMVQGQMDGVPTKPDPAGAHIVMEALGVTPDECIFMGDSAVDVKTAAASGALSVGVLWGFRERAELVQNGAKIIISHPSKLLELI